MTGTAPIAVALDSRDLETASAWARAVEPHVSTVKIGLELFCRFGPESVASVRGGSRIGLFLDLKLNDIPNTVAGAVRAVARLRPTYLTVHALGGRAMIAAAAEELPDGLIAAVTVLTSLDDADLTEFGFAASSQDAVRRLAVMSVSAGARAIVCSAREVAAVRAEVGPDIVLITPGVRTAGAGAQDQARVATPEQALAGGSDLLVIGREITSAADPGAAAASLAAALRRVSRGLPAPPEG
jgi:orotidine-5'-phosphate decarboxylase